MEKWSHLVHLGEKNVGLCLYIYIHVYVYIIFVYIFIALILPSVRVSISSLFSLGVSPFFSLVCQPNPCKLLPGTPLSVLQIMLSLEFLLLLVCLNHVAGDGKILYGTKSPLGRFSPKKKCVSLGNPFFVGHANLASHAKKNKDLQQKISSQWNFRPP